jgi:hypothetical protein
MMNSGGNVKLFMGESFVETSEDFANECKSCCHFLLSPNFFFNFFCVLIDCERKQKVYTLIALRIFLTSISSFVTVVGII